MKDSMFLVGLCVLTGVGSASGQATRFTASYTPVGSNITFRLSETNDSFIGTNVPVAGTWYFDVTTDGQSVTFDDFRLAYNGTVIVNDLVSMDVAFSISATGTRDINPIGGTIWDVTPFQMYGTLSGTYRSFQHVQAFNANVNPTGTSETFETRLNFDNWPTSLLVNRPHASATNSENTMAMTPTSLVMLEPFYEFESISVTHPDSVTLAAVTASLPGFNGDFDGDSDVDGSDILTWQRGLGGEYEGDDLADWQQDFGKFHAGVVNAVPEPSSMAMACGCLAIAGYAGQRRRAAGR